MVIEEPQASNINEKLPYSILTKKGGVLKVSLSVNSKQVCHFLRLQTCYLVLCTQIFLGFVVLNTLCLLTTLLNRRWFTLFCIIQLHSRQHILIYLTNTLIKLVFKSQNNFMNYVSVLSFLRLLILMNSLPKHSLDIKALI